MALRIVVVVLVVAFAAGSLLYTFSGSVAEENHKTGSEEAPVQFDLPHGAKSPDVKPAKMSLDDVPEIVAEVDGRPIKRDVYVRAMKMFIKSLGEASSMMDQEQFDSIKARMLDNFINSEILVRQAEKENLAPSASEIEENYAMLKKNFPSEEAFNKVLKEQGLTESEVKKDIVKNLTIQALLKKNIAEKVSVTPEDVRKQYDLNQLDFERPETVHAAHILARFDEKDGPEGKARAREKIDKIYARLKNGEDFSKVAAEESEDPGSKSRGGDLGFFGRGRMVPEFEKVAFETEPGKISGVVESRFGFHIIKVIEKKPAGTISFEEAKADIEKKLRREKTEKKIREYVERLRKEMNVKKFI